MKGKAPVEGRPLEDVELARRAREGDDAAYGDLVKRYGQIAFRVAWLVTRDRGEAEDAAQEAFVKAYYALPRFRPDSPFRPWLLKIVANEARNRARSTRRRQGLALRAAAVSDGDAAPSPETAALAVADRETLVAALNAPAATGPGGDRVPVPPRPVGERDSRRARRAPGDGQVPPLEGDGSPARGVGGAGMSERLRSMGDDDLGAALSSLDIEWPSTPLLHAAVMARATSERPAIVRLPLSRPKRIMLIAAATVLLLAGAAVAAKIVIDLGGVVVEVTPSRPGMLPTPSIAPTGEPVSLEEAAVLLGREVPVPAGLGLPDRVWADEVITEKGEVARVTLAWHARQGLPEISNTRYGAVLMVFEGDANLASKDLYEDTGVLEFESVDGVDYYWTTGTHLLELLTSEGVAYVRVEGNVLLWRDGPHTMRLETSLPMTEVLRIAASAGTP